MKFTNSRKILALLSFVTLIAAFVLYRAGVFDKYLTGNSYSIQSSPNGGPMNNSITDTVPLQKKDSIWLVKKDSLKEMPVMWSGSKSGRIITPGDFKTLHPDSTKRLDSQIKKKIDSVMAAPKKTVMMGSSKSLAPVFKPQDDELLRIIKIYQGDSAGLRRALERYFKGRN